MALTGLSEASSARKLDYFREISVTKPRVRRYIYTVGN